MSTPAVNNNLNDETNFETATVKFRPILFLTPVIHINIISMSSCASLHAILLPALLSVIVYTSIAIPAYTAEESSISQSVTNVGLKYIFTSDTCSSGSKNCLEERGPNRIPVSDISLMPPKAHFPINASRGRPTTVLRRNLVSNLRSMGITLFWDTMDIAIGSSLAYYQSTEFYTNISRSAGSTWRSRPSVRRLVITYGIFQLTFTSAGPILWQHVQDLAFILSFLAVGITFGTFRIIALAAYGIIVITLALVLENHRPTHLISAP